MYSDYTTALFNRTGNTTIPCCGSCNSTALPLLTLPQLLLVLLLVVEVAAVIKVAVLAQTELSCRDTIVA